MSFWDSVGLGGILGKQTNPPGMQQPLYGTHAGNQQGQLIGGGGFYNQQNALTQHQGAGSYQQMQAAFGSVTTGTVMYNPDPNRVVFIPMTPLAVIHAGSGKRLIVWEP